MRLRRVILLSLTLLLGAAACGRRVPGSVRLEPTLTPTSTPAAASQEPSPSPTVRPTFKAGRKAPQANADVFGNDLSADGRFVLMTSDATNLVRGRSFRCHSGRDARMCTNVFVRDRVVRRTEIVSVSSSGRRVHGDSGGNAISADGRFVVFTSDAPDLVAGAARTCTGELGDEGRRCNAVFVHDRKTGRTELVSVSSGGELANAPSYGLDVSADGRYVLFTSWASNLVSNDHNTCESSLDVTLASCKDAFVRDRRMGTTTLVSVAADGTQDSSPVTYASMSDDGRYVAFCCARDQSDSSKYGVVVRDMQSNVTTFVDGGDGIRTCCFDVQISADGNQVAYHDDFTPYVASRVDPRPSAVPRGNGQTWSHALSADGRWLALQSFSTDLMPGDRNGEGDCFLYDTTQHQTIPISIADDGSTLPKGSTQCLVSEDGSVASFSTIGAPIGSDTNHHVDVYVRSRISEAIERVSVPN